MICLYHIAMETDLSPSMTSASFSGNMICGGICLVAAEAVTMTSIGWISSTTGWPV